MTFADKVIDFNNQLSLDIKLPKGVEVMNPFKESVYASMNAELFYQKFYNDHYQRRLILGINPGRLGAGVTGVPFTDTKRFNEECEIPFTAFKTHEPSSVFVYEVIRVYGGPLEFYKNIYINSVCPLGFVIKDKNGKEKNYNYYDSAALTKAVTPFIIETIRKQIAIGCYTNVAYCMGTGSNFKFLYALNEKEHFFDKIIPLEHPRYVMQYKLKWLDEYVKKYIDALSAGY